MYLMTTESITIIMLAYILVCIGVYFLVTKYVIDKPKNPSPSIDDGNSVIEGLEAEQNIFELSEPGNEIDAFQIDSPYKKATVDNLLHDSKNRDDAGRIA